MKYNEIDLTRQNYNDSPYNKTGLFQPRFEYAQAFGWNPPYTDLQLDQSFESFKAQAWDDIAGANPERPLDRMIYSTIEATTPLISGLKKALICAIDNRRTNGQIEIKNASQFSSSSMSGSQDTNEILFHTLILDDSTETALQAFDYFNWNLQINDDGMMEIYVGNISLTTYKSINGKLWSAMFVKGQSNNILCDDEITKLIKSNISAIHLNLKTTIDFSSENDWEIKIDDFNNGNELDTTDGNKYSKSVASPGDVVLWRPTVDGTATLAEQTLIDSDKTMLKITAGNAELILITLLNSAIISLTDSKAEKTELSKTLKKSRDGGISETQMDDGYVPANDLDIVTYNFWNLNNVLISSQIQNLSDVIAANQNSISVIDTKTNLAFSYAQDWMTKKASYVKFEDLPAGASAGGLSVVSANVGTDGLSWTFPTGNADIAKMVGMLITRARISDGLSTEIRLYADYNDPNGEPQKILNNNVLVKITLAALTITGLSAANLSTLSSLKLTDLVQIGSTGGAIAAAIDTQARNDNAATQIVADRADNLSKANAIVISDIKKVKYADDLVFPPESITIADGSSDSYILSSKKFVLDAEKRAKDASLKIDGTAAFSAPPTTGNLFPSTQKFVNDKFTKNLQIFNGTLSTQTTLLQEAMKNGDIIWYTKLSSNNVIINSLVFYASDGLGYYIIDKPNSFKIISTINLSVHEYVTICGLYR